MDIRLIIIVGAGSFLGGITRYVVSQFMDGKFPGVFPYGTLTINILGCLLIGVLFGFLEKTMLNQEWRIFLATGILGGFTTFSAFSIETYNLIREGHSWMAVLYVLASVVAGLMLTVLGFYLARS